jgi:hypothetical protein
MTTLRYLGLAGLLAATALFAACGGDRPSSPAGEGGGEGHEEAAHDDGAHDHAVGPHGGAMVVLGDHEVHLEALHHEAEHAVEVYAYDADLGPLAFDAAPMLKVAGPGGQVSLTGTAVDGGGWRFEDDALASEPERARFQIRIGGMTFVPDLPAHAHGEDEYD